MKQSTGWVPVLLMILVDVGMFVIPEPHTVMGHGNWHRDQHPHTQHVVNTHFIAFDGSFASCSIFLELPSTHKLVFVLNFRGYSVTTCTINIGINHILKNASVCILSCYGWFEGLLDMTSKE